MKASKRFRREFIGGLRALREGLPTARCFVVYRGAEELLVDGVHVLPVEEFLRRLHAGEIIG